MDIAEVKRRLHVAHGDTVSIDESTYVGFKRQATFIDRDYGKWIAYVYAICRGQRHKQRFLDNKPKKPKLVKPKRSRGEIQRYTLEEIQELLNAKAPNTKIIGPYHGMNVKCKFLDIDFGEFEAFPMNVVHKGSGHIKRAVKRREETSIKKFGTRHHMQNDAQFLKHLKAQRKHIKELHWKTKEILNCINNWELAFVRWCNEKKLDFLWQPKAFTMPDGHTYRPDAYIIGMDLWIDIKGYYPESSRKKCEWFKSIMPNFEVWRKDDLIKHGIL